jgi:hypothetical protein
MTISEIFTLDPCYRSAQPRLGRDIGSLIRRFPRIELAREPEFDRRMTLRGLRELRLVLGT